MTLTHYHNDMSVCVQKVRPGWLANLRQLQKGAENETWPRVKKLLAA